MRDRIYILYRQEDLAKELGKSVLTIKENLNELVEAGLIEKRRADKGRANMIFVKAPESSITDGKAPVYEPVNKPYKGKKFGSLSVGFQATNDSNSNRDIKPKYIYGEDTF